MELPVKGWRVSVDPFVLILLAISLSGNIYLALQVTGRPTPEQQSVKPAIGDSVGAFAAQDAAGTPRVFAPADTQLNTVYYMFTPSCTWCARNLENIRAISARAPGNYRFVAISLDPNIASYIEANRIEFPVVVNPTRTTGVSYGLGSVPQTVVVSPEGKVLRHWKGAYGPGVLEDVSGFLSVELPGLTDPARSSNE